MSFISEETIAAICTAITAGEGGVAIIRISGPSAIEIGQDVVSIYQDNPWDSHTILYGHVMDIKKIRRLDEVLVLIMKSPRSFTGEDVIEIHCHGGRIAVQEVLQRVLEHPKARRAKPGEFSQRAVLNGRIDLTQAESISELINARSRKAAELAVNGVDGGINRSINKLRSELIDQLSELEARIDFEEDLPPLNPKDILHSITLVQSQLNKLLLDTSRSNSFKYGIKAALIGSPNVGKSSLLNHLSRLNRAIVTESPGTTRDLLESEIILKGVPITLIDTAGIRDTENQIEKLGIIKTNEALMAADIVILIFDLSIGWSPTDQNLLSTIPNGTPRIVVGNKADLLQQNKLSKRQGNESKSKQDITFSALTGDGEEDLIENLLNICGACEGQSVEISLNERQQDLAKLAIVSLEKVKDIEKLGLPWDFWTIDLRDAIHHLGEITGDEITEALLDRIFSRFCIGK